MSLLWVLAPPVPELASLPAFGEETYLVWCFLFGPLIFFVLLCNYIV